MSQLREDLLICRVIDGDASPDEWAELQRLAGRDPAVWRTLADTLREHHAFARAVTAEVAVADDVPLPPAGRGSTTITTRPSPIARIGRWSGWVLAAVVTLAWVSGWIPTPAPRGSTTGITPIANTQPTTADDALQQYLELGRREGRVIGLPERVLVDRRPAPDGNGVELLYMQPILLRESVPDA